MVLLAITKVDVVTVTRCVLMELTCRKESSSLNNRTFDFLTMRFMDATKSGTVQNFNTEHSFH